MSAPMLEVRDLKKYFPVRQTIGEVLQRKPPAFVKAIDGVTFAIAEGEVLALVGESGCGKTTIARTLLGLEDQSAGDIRFDGQTIEVRERRRRAGLIALEGSPSPQVVTREQMSMPTVSLKRLRQHAQMIFQDPYESLNPRSTIFDIVAEPLEVHGLARQRAERVARVTAALEDAGLRPAADYFLRYPHELSGGQRQRVVIAGALVLEPELLIADEPVSMLDVSIRADILNLLRGLRDARGISILFITHDLGTVAYFADRIAVMYLGRIVEIGPRRAIFENPQHPYTRKLMAAVPIADPARRHLKRALLEGEIPSPIRPVGDEPVVPPLQEVGPGHFVAPQTA